MDIPVALILDALPDDHAAPAADDVFDLHRHVPASPKAPGLVGFSSPSIPVLATVLVHSYWSARMRRVADIPAQLASAVMAWSVLEDVTLFVAASDQTSKDFIVLMIAFTLIRMDIKLRHTVRPIRGLQARA